MIRRRLGRSGAAALAFFAAMAFSCGLREGRVERLSLSFMVKGPDLKARRDAELLGLVRLGALRMGMTIEKVKLLLGEPNFVWESAPQVETDKGFEKQLVYRLGPGESLRLDFSAGRVARARRHVEGPWELGGGFTDIELEGP